MIILNNLVCWIVIPLKQSSLFIQQNYKGTIYLEHFTGFTNLHHRPYMDRSKNGKVRITF